MTTPANKIIDEPANAGIASGGGESAVAELEPMDRTDFPCSVAQERFWLLDRLDPGNASYNVAVRWRLEGRVQTDLLERSWHAIIHRHEILRTTFHEVDGAPLQRVSPNARFRLSEIDLAALERSDSNYPTREDSVKDAELVQWCHGAPSFAMLFLTLSIHARGTLSRLRS